MGDGLAVVVAALAVAVGAVCQAITGFGFSLVSAPFLIAAYRAPEGVQINLVLSSVLNLALLLRERRDTDVRSAAFLIVPGAIATFAVAAIVHRSRSGAMTIAAGALCLLGVAAVARGRAIRGIGGRVGTAAVGAVSGAMNVAAGIGGPPVVLFALNAKWSPARARATLQAFFLGINVFGLIALGFPRHLPIPITGGLLVGLAAGHFAGRRFSDSSVRAAALWIAAAGSILAIARGIAT